MNLIMEFEIHLSDHLYLDLYGLNTIITRIAGSFTPYLLTQVCVGTALRELVPLCRSGCVCARIWGCGDATDPFPVIGCTLFFFFYMHATFLLFDALRGSSSTGDGAVGHTHTGNDGAAGVWAYSS